MQRRQPLPRLWLMTDERQGERLWEALARLPRGAGIVFRHYGLTTKERRRLFSTVKMTTKRRHSILLVGRLHYPGADGVHGGRHGISASAHNLRELRTAERQGAAFVFVSPVFPTRSHPGAKALGRVRFGLLAQQARIPVIALGGMDARKGRSLKALGAYGWAGIDAWSDDQKRKAVPM
jgi:thiamine-phosphate pyrophosphorylase